MAISKIWRKKCLVLILMSCWCVSKSVKIPKFHIFERYIEFLFVIQFWCGFIFVEWIVLRAFVGMLTDLTISKINLTEIKLLLFQSKRGLKGKNILFFLLKSFFNGLELNIGSYVKMNIKKNSSNVDFIEH